MTVPANKVMGRNRLSQKLENYSFPEDIGTHGLLMIFKNYEYQDTRGLLNNRMVTVKQNSSVLLPIPASIQDSFSLRVQRFDQGTMGDMISRGAAGASGVDNDTSMDDVRNAISGNLPSGSSIADGLSSSSGGGALGSIASSANFLLRKVLDSTSPNLTRNIDAGFGKTINPKAALSFDGIELKKHSFDWTLAPNSPNESDIIKRISNLIKRNILPTYDDFGTGEAKIIQRAMLKYPSTVELYFIGVDASHYYFFKTCMVESFNVNYAPQGLSILKGGKPSVVSMSIQLAEMDIHTATDYED